MKPTIVVRRDAVISPCKRYRYSLTRDWSSEIAGIGKGRVLFVMLNPSTADADRDDPTIRRCIGFVRRWGYTSLEVVNLFAWRATDPRALLAARHSGENVVGPDNEAAIRTAAARAALVVAAWGVALANPLNTYARGLEVWKAMQHSVPGRFVQCIVETDDGWPRHPLMLKADLDPKKWSAWGHA